MGPVQPRSRSFGILLASTMIIVSTLCGTFTKKIIKSASAATSSHLISKSDILEHFPEEVLLISKGHELKDGDPVDARVFALTRISHTTSQHVKICVGRSSFHTSRARSVGSLSRELYEKKLVSHKPLEQRVIINGKTVQPHILLGDVCLFVGGKLNVTVVSAPPRHVTVDKASTHATSGVLQKVPSRKRSCTTQFKGLQKKRGGSSSARDSLSSFTIPHQQYNQHQHLSPPVTPAKG
jgi:hypothetical protein